MKSRYLYPLSDSSVEERGGNKAKNLRYLMKRKYPVNVFYADQKLPTFRHDVGKGVVALITTIGNQQNRRV